ncbi:hypothetical protein D049_3710B, partial [Vibrio parahaemolyticus VPTS-2010]
MIATFTAIEFCESFFIHFE